MGAGIVPTLAGCGDALSFEAFCKKFRKIPLDPFKLLSDQCEEKHAEDNSPSRGSKEFAEHLQGKAKGNRPQLLPPSGLLLPRANY